MEINRLIKIFPLSRFPEYSPVLAYWSYNLWYTQRDIEYHLVLKSYKERADNKRLPVAFVAVDQTLPVGMASLKENDLWSRKDLNPWLASLYVVPEYRGMGIGKKLINAVTGRADERGDEKIYLFTSDFEGFDLNSYYTSSGWEFIEDGTDNDGKTTKIYSWNIL